MFRPAKVYAPAADRRAITVAVMVAHDAGPAPRGQARGQKGGCEGGPKGRHVRRLFYVAFGAAAGVLVVRRVSQAAQKWTPEGLAGQASGFGDRIVHRAEAGTRPPGPNPRPGP